MVLPKPTPVTVSQHTATPPPSLPIRRGWMRWGSGRWQWWPQPRNAPILKRHLAGWLQQNFEAAEGQSSAVFTPHHRSAPYVRPQAGYAADTQPPATPHQPHHANAQLPPHPTYSLSPWLHVSQHGPSLAANQDPPGNSEDDSPSEDISLKFLQYLDYENGITAQASFESPYSLIYLLESFLHGVAVDPAACRVASLGSSVTRVEVVETS